MTKKYLILLALLTLTLTLLLSGCGTGGQNLDGKYIVTFDLNGGTLDLKSTNVTSKINQAYEPGSYILNPATHENNEIFRSGYRFTGWYTSAECKEQDKWDFAADTINQEKITLYAGWIKEIVYTYSVCYVDGENTVTLGTYNVAQGAAFEDYRKHADKRADFTANGYYSDAACTVPWNFETVHPGGETDTDIRVYVDYIPGKWKLVDSYAELKAAIGEGDIYLTADIDCGGEELFFNGTFTHVLEGNGHKISNFTVNKFGGALMPSVAIFQTLGAGAEIRNIAFEQVTFSYMDVDRATRIKVAALAREASDCIVSDVSISGTMITNYEGEFPRLNEAFYDEESTGTVTGFTANVTVEKQS